MTTQLTLGVNLKDDATFQNYYAGNNQQLVQALAETARGRGEQVIYFWGNEGTGRTHLLQACCHAAQQQHLSSVYLPLTTLIDLSPALFEGLESLALICVDNIHVIAGNAAWEEAFFHAYNRIHAAGSRLIVTANSSPQLLGLALPDVVSRLAWGTVYQLHALSDEEKLIALMARAQKRGLVLAEEVGKFLLHHCPRNMPALFAALDQLDKVSLQQQRRLTIPFVKTVLLKI